MAEVIFKGSETVLKCKALLESAHKACFNHPDRPVLGMSHGPFSGGNEVLGIISSMDEEIEHLKEIISPLGSQK